MVGSLSSGAPLNGGGASVASGMRPIGDGHDLESSIEGFLIDSAGGMNVVGEPCHNSNHRFTE